MDPRLPVTDANLRAMLEGRAPTGENGQKIQLHHRGGEPNLRVDEYDSDLHKQPGMHHTDDDSRIDRYDFSEQRARYWVTRARQILGADD
jgi:hypothetical protein